MSNTRDGLAVRIGHAIKSMEQLRDAKDFTELFHQLLGGVAAQHFSHVSPNDLALQISATHPPVQDALAEDGPGSFGDHAEWAILDGRIPEVPAIGARLDRVTIQLGHQASDGAGSSIWVHLHLNALLQAHEVTSQLSQGLIHLDTRGDEQHVVHVFLAVLVLGPKVGKTDVDSLGGSASGAVGTEPIYKDSNPKNDFTFIHTTQKCQR